MNPKDFNDGIAAFVLGKRIVGIFFDNDLDAPFALLFDDGTVLDISVSSVNVPEGGAPVIAYGTANTIPELYGRPLALWDFAGGMLYRLETAP